MMEEVLEGDLQDEIRRTKNREFRSILIFISELFQRNLTVTAVCRLPSSFQDDDD